MAKMLFNSVVSALLLIFWLSQAEASRSVFQNYFELQDAWLACIRFDFARHTAIGVAWKNEVSVSGADGNLCPPSPDGSGLFESHLYRSLFETIMAAMVAISFSWGYLEAAGARCKNLTGVSPSLRPASSLKLLQTTEVKVSSRWNLKVKEEAAKAEMRPALTVSHNSTSSIDAAEVEMRPALTVSHNSTSSIDAAEVKNTRESSVRKLSSLHKAGSHSFF